MKSTILVKGIKRKYDLCTEGKMCKENTRDNY